MRFRNSAPPHLTTLHMFCTLETPKYETKSAASNFSVDPQAIFAENEVLKQNLAAAQQNVKSLQQNNEVLNEQVQNYHQMYNPAFIFSVLPSDKMGEFDNQEDLDGWIHGYVSDEEKLEKFGALHTPTISPESPLSSPSAGGSLLSSIMEMLILAMCKPSTPPLAELPATNRLVIITKPKIAVENAQVRPDRKKIAKFTGFACATTCRSSAKSAS